MRAGPRGPGLGQGQPGGPGLSCSPYPSMAQGSLCLSREAQPGGPGAPAHSSVFVESRSHRRLHARVPSRGHAPAKSCSSCGVASQHLHSLSLWRDSCNLERFHRLCPGPCSSVRNKVPNKHVLSALLTLPLGTSFLTGSGFPTNLLLGPRVAHSASSLQTQLT